MNKIKKYMKKILNYQNNIIKILFNIQKFNKK